MINARKWWLTSFVLLSCFLLGRNPSAQAGRVMPSFSADQGQDEVTHSMCSTVPTLGLARARGRVEAVQQGWGALCCPPASQWGCFHKKQPRAPCHLHPMKTVKEFSTTEEMPLFDFQLNAEGFVCFCLFVCFPNLLVRVYWVWLGLISQAFLCSSDNSFLPCLLPPRSWSLEGRCKHFAAQSSGNSGSDRDERQSGSGVIQSSKSAL